MADFDPDAYLAAPAAPASQPETQADTSDFDPDAYLQSANAEKYGTGKQQALAGLEGAARGVIGPVAPYVEKHLLKVPQEDIAGRQEANPITAGLGEGVGLGGSMLLGTGEGALLAKAGEAAEAATGLGKAAAAGKELSYANKVGSSVVKNAAEMAALQASDEASKYIVTDQDPTTAAETAISNIGLAAALGGATGGFLTGAVSPLWKATVGPGIEKGLNGILTHFGGTEAQAGEAALQRTSARLEQDSGIAIPQVLKPVIDDAPGAKAIASGLNQSDTYMAGKSFQKSMDQVENDVADNIVTQLGRSPKDVTNAPKLNTYDRSQEAGQTLISEVKDMAKPIQNRYEAVTNEFKDSPLSGGVKGKMVDDIAQTAMQQGWSKANGGVSQKFAEGIMSDLGKQESVNDLKNFITNLRQDNPFGSPNYQASKRIGQIVQNGLESSIGENMVSKVAAGGTTAEGMAAGQQKVTEYNQLRNDYKDLMNKFDGLNEHLHIGRYSGPESFVTKLGEKFSSKGEQMLNRLTSVKNMDVLQQLQNFPKTLEHVKNYHVDEMLRDATKNPPPGKSMNVRSLIKDLRNLPPQVQELIANQQQHKIIDASGEILKNLHDENYNYSNTARTLGKQGSAFSTPLAMIMGLAHGTGSGLAALAASVGGGELKDGTKLALLKFLASDKPVNAAGFSAMTKMAAAAVKGETQMNKAVASVFKPGAAAVASFPTSQELMKLDKLMATNSQNPEAELHQQDSDLGHYLPQHQMAATAVTQQAQQYLQNLKPKPYQPSPLDRPIEPTQAETARYNRALSIAQNPTLVMQHIKDGSLQASDIQDLHNMYPSLYKVMATKLSNQMQAQASDQEQIPYKTRMGLSLFLGQPIESSMQPASIQAAQPMPQQPPPQAAGKPMKNRKGPNSLGKSSQEYKTPGQAAESDRANRE